MRFSKFKLFAAILLLLAALGVSACFRITADELYSLPQASDEYIRLQAHLNSVLRDGAEFSPPLGGPNRQSVQQVDLNGNGTSEVIAFFSFPGDSTLKIYIFEMIDNDYSVVEIIEGVGTAFESVRYVDMDGDGSMEIIIGWQLGAALKHMSIFSMRGLQRILLAEAVFTTITVFDITGDGSYNIIVTRLPTQETGAVAEVFTLMADGEMISSEARLSSGVESISSVSSGRLLDGVPAVFIESEGRFDTGGLVTDVCIFRDGALMNISVYTPSGISEETIRTQNPYLLSADINNDGVIKIPMPRVLKAQSETTYHAIDWYALDSMGNSHLELTTYHNSFEEWFLIMPFDWRGRVSVRREDVVTGERTVIFSHITGDDGPFEDFLKIYKLSGDMRFARARLPGRAMLISDETAVYAFELIALPNSYGLTFDEPLIRANFRLIYSDWLAGTT